MNQKSSLREVLQFVSRVLTANTQQQRSGGLGKLSEANFREVAKQSESERQASAARSAAERRAELFLSASASLDVLYSSVSEAITEAAPSVKRGMVGKRKGITLSLGTAQLEMVPIFESPPGPWARGVPVFDVVAYAGIIIRVPRDRYEFEGRSHSLWYCDAFEKDRYEWVETALMVSPMVPKMTTMRPFMADPGPEAAAALWVGIAEFQLAWPIEPVASDDFIDRWASWLADAAYTERPLSGASCPPAVEAPSQEVTAQQGALAARRERIGCTLFCKRFDALRQRAIATRFDAGSGGIPCDPTKYGVRRKGRATASAGLRSAKPLQQVTAGPSSASETMGRVINHMIGLPPVTAMVAPEI